MKKKAITKVLSIVVSGYLIMSTTPVYARQLPVSIHDDAIQTMNASDIVHIPDVKFRAVLNRNIYQTIGDAYDQHPITKQQLAHLDTLNVLNVKGVKSIEGIQYCTSITQINLDGQEITDLRPLANLTQVTMLGVNQNKVQDISPLSSLSSLRILTLEHNEIEDVSPLSELKTLSMVSLDGNRIKNISPLKTLTGLRTLYIENQAIRERALVTSLSTVKVFNVIEDINGDFIAPSPSTTYDYKDGRIEFKHILSSGDHAYNFYQEFRIGSASAAFSGQVTHHITKQ